MELRARTGALCGLAAVAIAGACLAVSPTGAFEAAAQVREALTQMDTVDIEAVAADGVVDIYDGTMPSSIDIVNEGVRAWVRVKPVLTADAGEVQIVNTSLLDSTAWTYAADGWFYRTAALEENETVDFTVPIEAPAAWGRGIEIACEYEIEAVQADNFEPDFTGEKPWGDLEPESAIYVRQGAEDGDEVGVEAVTVSNDGADDDSMTDGSKSGTEDDDAHDGSVDVQGAGFSDKEEEGDGSLNGETDGAIEEEEQSLFGEDDA